MESEINTTPAEVAADYSNKPPRRPRRIKLVQVGLNPDEYSLVCSMADQWGISIPDAVRRSIHRSEWLDRLTNEGTEELVIGTRDKESGELRIVIPVPNLPIR